MSLEIEHLPALFGAWRERWAERDARNDIMDAVVAGDFAVYDPDEETVESRSPNMIQVALEDTADAASLIPTVRIQPTKLDDSSRKKASDMEKIASGYLDHNQIDYLVPRSVLDAGAYGTMVWTVSPDEDQNAILIERRDPRTCYPEPGFRTGDTVRRAFFSRELYVSQLPDKYSQILYNTEGVGPDLVSYPDFLADPNLMVIFVEYYDEEEIVLAALYGGAGDVSTREVPFKPVELERIEHKAGVCPVTLEGRITLDGEPRGQFDQVVDMMYGHIRLMGLVLDYADQAVYSDVWVRDLIGEMPYGGGSYIELGPNGAIGRVPPAVSSLNIQQDLEQLIDGIHLGGRWPKSRPGEIDQSIASAKFLEASAGMMNTAIRAYHQLLQRHISKALRIGFAIDRTHLKGERIAIGVTRNQEFIQAYDTDDIDPSAKVRVEYGLGFGRDPAQSALLHIQYAQNGYIAGQTVQENTEGITDVEGERAKIDVEQLEDMAKAKILQGLQSGQIPDRSLSEIAKKRRSGQDFFDLFEEYIVEPQEEAQEQAVETGLGPALQPGPMEAPPGDVGAVPPAPEGSDLLSRMNIPAGPGGTLGAQTIQEGGP